MDIGTIVENDKLAMANMEMATAVYVVNHNGLVYRNVLVWNERAALRRYYNGSRLGNVKARGGTR